mgnify:FL=1
MLQNKGRHRSIAYNIFISVVFELLKDLDLEYKLGRQQLQYDLNDVGIIVQNFLSVFIQQLHIMRIL